MSTNSVVILINVMTDYFVHDADKIEKTSISQLLNFLPPDFVVSILLTSYIIVSTYVITDFFVSVCRRHQIHPQ